MSMGGGMDPEMMERNALVLASHGNLAQARELVESRPELVNEPGVGPAFGGERPLDAAAHTHNRAIAETLLEHGAEHNVYSATFMGEFNLVSEMLKADPALVRTPGVHSIPILGFVEDHALAEMLIEAGAEVNAASREPFRTTPLHGAARRGNVKVVETLLLNGADTTTRDYNDKTPRDLATDEDVIALLDAHDGKAARPSPLQTEREPGNEHGQ